MGYVNRISYQLKMNIKQKSEHIHARFFYIYAATPQIIFTFPFSILNY